MNFIGNVIKNLFIYFLMIFIGEYIMAKIFEPVELIPWCLVYGKYFKAFCLAIIAFLLYFIAAGAVMAQDKYDDNGKFVMFVIFIYSVYGMYEEINQVAGSAEGLRYLGTAIGYMLFAIPDTLRIIATFCVLLLEDN